MRFPLDCLSLEMLSFLSLSLFFIWQLVDTILIPFCLLKNKQSFPFLASFLYYLFQHIPETSTQFNKLLHGNTYLKCFSFLSHQDQIAFTVSKIVCSRAQ